MIVRLAATATLALVASCATVPTVDYHQLGPGARNDKWVPFHLTDSIVVIGAPIAKAADGAAAPPVDLSPVVVRCPGGVCGAVAVAAIPTDFRGVLYGLEPRSRRLVSTILVPSYVSNSLRLKALAVEAKDHRLEAINTVAALASGAARLADKGTDLSNPDPLDRTAQLILPVTIALADLRCTGPTCRSAATPRLPRNPTWTYSIEFRDDPAESGLLARQAVDTVHAAMVASACRPVRIMLYQADQKVTVVLDVEVADPDWLITVPFPTKGAMTFHSLCGVDVQAQAITDIGVDVMATAFVNGVEAVARQK